MLSSLLLGKAKVDITPPVGIHLGGWKEERFSDSIHQPLTCRVFFIEQGEKQIVLISLDLLGISNQLADQFRKQIEMEVGVSASSIMISATHTHSGPILPPCIMPGLPEPDERYIEDLQRKITGAVKVTKSDLIPVAVGYGKGESDLGISRRLPYDNGKVGYPPKADSEGDVDSEVGILRFDSLKDGAPVAVMFSYGCHPTVGGPSSWIGPDYPGTARNFVESFYGEDVMAMFLLGNSADVRTNYTMPNGRFSWDTSTTLVEEAGYRIGAEVIKQLVQIKTDSNAELANSQVFSDIYMKNGEVGSHCEFQAFKLGDAVIVTNPGECFAKIGLNVREEFDFPILFSSITNGFLGYVPTKDAHKFGGYEVEISYDYFGLDSPINEDGEKVFFAGMKDAINKL